MYEVQIRAFLSPLLDRDTIGVDCNGNEFEGQPICPELHSFVLARLGHMTPINAYRALRPQPGGPDAEKSRALAALLREVINGLDPLASKP